MSRAVFESVGRMKRQTKEKGTRDLPNLVRGIGGLCKPLNIPQRVVIGKYRSLQQRGHSRSDSVKSWGKALSGEEGVRAGEGSVAIGWAKLLLVHPNEGSSSNTPSESLWWPTACPSRAMRPLDSVSYGSSARRSVSSVSIGTAASAAHLILERYLEWTPWYIIVFFTGEAVQQGGQTRSKGVREEMRCGLLFASSFFWGFFSTAEWVFPYVSTNATSKDQYGTPCQYRLARRCTNPYGARLRRIQGLTAR